jgi:hypothetical protein
MNNMKEEMNIILTGVICANQNASTKGKACTVQERAIRKGKSLMSQSVCRKAITGKMNIITGTKVINTI